MSESALPRRVCAGLPPLDSLNPDPDAANLVSDANLELDASFDPVAGFELDASFDPGSNFDPDATLDPGSNFDPDATLDPDAPDRADSPPRLLSTLPIPASENDCAVGVGAPSDALRWNANALSVGVALRRNVLVSVGV